MLMKTLRAWFGCGENKPQPAKPADKPNTFSRECNCDDPDCQLHEQYPVKWNRNNLMISRRCKTVPPATKCLGVYPRFALYRVE